MIHLIVNLKPIPKERPRFGKGHVYTPSKTAKYESHIKMLAKAMIDEPYSGPVEVRLVFNFIKAKSSKKEMHTQRPDIDNLQKCVLDSLNGVAYLDDCQVIRLYSEKNFSAVENIEITVIEIK